ncbi:hypothetical protein WA1_03270 [Scytonema hofmannii PCC 7110]|uniref:Uncharacterized protein n=2 Tax=Scytonema hofmannii TaxID=34078 RepID=A0A139XHK1_9CYAN|nr:hypothetical protein WA1_03270 [Scytonema hofmannii PCC 7110]
MVKETGFLFRLIRAVLDVVVLATELLAKAIEWETNDCEEAVTGIQRNTTRIRIFVGWDHRGETQQMPVNVGFRSSTQPTYFRIFTQNLRSIELTTTRARTTTIATSNPIADVICC